MPPSNVGWAVAALVFFWPLSFVAFTASSNVTRFWLMGDFGQAQQASDQAKRLGKISLIILAVIVALYIAVFVIFVVTAASTVNQFS